MALALGLSFGNGTAFAHDTWLEARPAPPGRIALALTSGTLFPAGETAVAASSLVEQGCIDATGTRVPLLPTPPSPASASALVLQASAAADGAAVQSCWAQTERFEIELPERLVPVYLREIAAPESVRARWLADRRQGLPWRERYAKHARISIGIAPKMRAAHSVPMAMDIDLSSATVPLRAGAVIEFRVLRDGAPLAGQAVELRGDMSRLGLWRLTDGEGRASVPVPFAGRWVLRATDLRPVPGRPGEWDSRFATHTFTVESPAADATAEGATQTSGDERAAAAASFSRTSP